MMDTTFIGVLHTISKKQNVLPCHLADDTTRIDRHLMTMMMKIIFGEYHCNDQYCDAANLGTYYNSVLYAGLKRVSSPLSHFFHGVTGGRNVTELVCDAEPLAEARQVAMVL